MPAKDKKGDPRFFNEVLDAISLLKDYSGSSKKSILNMVDNMLYIKRQRLKATDASIHKALQYGLKNGVVKLNRGKYRLNMTPNEYKFFTKVKRLKSLDNFYKKIPLDTLCRGGRRGRGRKRRSRRRRRGSKSRRRRRAAKESTDDDDGSDKDDNESTTETEKSGVSSGKDSLESIIEIRRRKPRKPTVKKRKKPEPRRRAVKTKPNPIPSNSNSKRRKRNSSPVEIHRENTTQNITVEVDQEIPPQIVESQNPFHAGSQENNHLAICPLSDPGECDEPTCLCNAHRIFHSDGEQ